MHKLYEKVDTILKRVDFAAIWPGFRKFAFALYDEETVTMSGGSIPYDRRFLGNTSIDYEGEPMAIWQVLDPSAEEPETLAANMVHEMFHAFQGVSGEKRYADPMLMLRYPDDRENYILKHSENLLLADVFDTTDLDMKKQLLGRFISAREYRRSIMGGALELELLNETQEGMAEYAGCMALKQISPEDYEKRIRKYMTNIQRLDEEFFHIRRLCYFTGALFCIALHDTGEKFYHDLGATDKPVFDMVSAEAKPEKPAVQFDENILLTAIEQHANEKRKKFDGFLSGKHKETSGDFVICGYDPMNTIFLDDMLLCSHFIKLKSGDSEAMFLKGPVIVRMKPGELRNAAGYVTEVE